MPGIPSSASTVRASARPQRAFPPRIIGSWKIDALLGEGNFARTYRARPADCPMSRPADYVMKVLKKELETQEQVVQMVRREAYVGRHVSHPHLVPILDAAVRKNTGKEDTANKEPPPYFVVMPFLQGATLRDTVSDTELPPVPHALWIARQVAEGLTALHESGWLHGDIKPSNIFVSDEGHVTLIDLGMARPTLHPGSVSDRPLTGSLHYLPPELVNSAVRADQRSDIYSLGVTLYWALTGRLPFTADSVDALLRAHREITVPDPRRVRPQLPRNLCRYVLSMMAKQPLRRPQTAKEVAEALMNFEIETFEERVAA